MPNKDEHYIFPVAVDGQELYVTVRRRDAGRRFIIESVMPAFKKQAPYEIDVSLISPGSPLPGGSTPFYRSVVEGLRKLIGQNGDPV